MPELPTTTENPTVENNQKQFLRPSTFKKYRTFCIISLVLGTLIILGGVVCFIYVKSERNRFESVLGGSIRNLTTTTEGNNPIGFNGTQNLEDVRMKVICTTKLCKETALDIQNSMNLTVNPCENFYDFACSGYRPRNYREVTRFHEVILKYNDITKDMTDRLKGLPRANDHAIIRYARDVYNNCLKTGTQTDSIYVRDFIRKMLGIAKWPSQELLEGLGTNYLNEKTAEFHLQFSLSPFFSVGVILPSLEDKVIFDIKEPTFLLPMELRSIGNQNSLNDFRIIFNSYSSYVYELMMESGGYFDDRDETDLGRFEKMNLKEMSEEVVRFEQALFDITDVHTNKTGYEEFTLYELDGLSEHNDLKKTESQAALSLSLRETLEHILQKTGNPSLQDHDKIRIFNSTVLENMVSLISTTKKEIVVNYLGYRLANYLIPFSPRLMQLYEKNPYTIATSVIPSGSTTACMDSAKEIFFPALTRYPEQMTEEQRSMFGENVEKNLREMFSNIKTELIRNLPHNNQLTEDRKISALEDIKNVRFCQDNWLFNQTGLEEYYAGIHPLENSYLEQYSTLRSWYFAKYYYSLNGKFLSELDACDLTGPSYNPLSRQINLPPFVWMEPFYEHEWPRYLKYSGIGFHISHEWMHALFRLVPEWIDNPMAKKNLTQKINLSVKDAFLEARMSPFPTLHLSNIVDKKTFQSSECIIDHYDDFSPGSLAKRDGIRTFQENFADIGGMKLAYSVYKSGLYGAVEETLPGFEEYSNEQLFFLNYARGWCDTRPVINWDQTDVHTPSKYRILGALRNSEEFSRAWKCPVGSYMNPVDKCLVF